MELAKNKATRLLAKAAAFAAAASSVVSMTMTAFAEGEDAGAAEFAADAVSVTGSQGAGDIMGKIIGVLLTIARYVGVALIVYGVYEVVMSFMQNQPEAKTKGIIMALSGAAMTALKTILKGVGVIS